MKIGFLSNYVFIIHIYKFSPNVGLFVFCDFVWFCTSMVVN